jgi:hypothetical protein
LGARKRIIVRFSGKILSVQAEIKPEAHSNAFFFHPLARKSSGEVSPAPEDGSRRRRCYSVDLRSDRRLQRPEGLKQGIVGAMIKGQRTIIFMRCYCFFIFVPPMLKTERLPITLVPAIRAGRSLLPSHMLDYPANS